MGRDEEGLSEEERANLPWNNEDDDESARLLSPNIKEPDSWAMYTYNEESDYYQDKGGSMLRCFFTSAFTSCSNFEV